MRRGLFAMALVLSAAHAQAQVTVASVFLYQPDAVATERLGGNAQALGDYVKALERAFAGSLGKYDGPPRSIAVAVVLKPGGQSRLWYAPEPAADPAVETIYRRVASALASQKPPQVQGGTFGFAINFSLAGGKPAAPNRMPAPPEWVAVPKARNATMRVDEIWAVVWPDAKPAAETKAPEIKARAPEQRAPEPEAPVAKKPGPAIPKKPVEAKAPEPPKPAGPCFYKPVMTDEELARCR